MAYRPNPDNQGWVTCRDRLLETIAKWQKKYRAEGVSVECPAAPRYTASFASPADRAVSVTFTAGKHIERTVTIDRFARPVDNLWALAIGLRIWTRLKRSTGPRRSACTPTTVGARRLSGSCRKPMRR